MGLMIVPVPERAQENLVYASDGRFIIEFMAKLDAICKRNGVKRLSDFFLDDVNSASIPRFYRVHEGLETVSLLKRELGGSEVENKPLMEQLILLEDWLRHLGEANRFYLVIA